MRYLAAYAQFPIPSLTSPLGLLSFHLASDTTHPPPSLLPGPPSRCSACRRRSHRCGWQAHPVCCSFLQDFGCCIILARCCTSAVQLCDLYVDDTGEVPSIFTLNHECINRPCSHLLCHHLPQLVENCPQLHDRALHIAQRLSPEGGNRGASVGICEYAHAGRIFQHMTYLQHTRSIFFPNIHLLEN